MFLDGYLVRKLKAERPGMRGWIPFIIIIIVCVTLLYSIEETVIILRSSKESINLSQKSFS